MVSSSIWASWVAHSGCRLAVTPSCGEARHVVGVRRPAGARCGARSWPASRALEARPAPRGRPGRRSRGSAPGSRAASSAATYSRSAPGSTKDRPRCRPCRSGRGTGSSIAAVKFSAMPSCMIFTARRPEPVQPLGARAGARRGRGSARRRASRSHHSAPTTAGLQAAARPRPTGRSGSRSSDARVGADDGVLPAGDARARTGSAGASSRAAS